MSERRVCRLLEIDRSSYRYRPRPKQDEELCARMRELAAQHPRYGYRRLGVLLRREGRRVNHKEGRAALSSTGSSCPAPPTGATRAERSHFRDGVGASESTLVARLRL